MNKRLVIFDLDGTLLDTLEDLADSVNFALRQHGFPVRTISEVRTFVGNGMQKLVERAVPENTDVQTVQEVLKQFQAYYAAHCTCKTKPYDGILPLLQKLRERGIRTAVVSNKGDFAVQALCADYFPDLLDFAVGEKEGIRRKPWPDSVMAVLAHFQAAAEEAVYVGDSDVDIETAQNVGIDCISVTWGFRDEAFLRAHGAVRLVSRPEDMLFIGKH